MTSYLRRKRVPTRDTHCCEPPNRRRQYYGLASSLILSSAMALTPSLALAKSCEPFIENSTLTLPDGKSCLFESNSDDWKLIDLGEDSTLFIKIKIGTNIVEINTNSLRSKKGAKIEYDKNGPGSYAKSLVLQVKEDGSGIEELSIIGTGRDGKHGSNGGSGGNGRDAYYYMGEECIGGGMTKVCAPVPKCKSATSGSAGGNGTDATDGESGMSIDVRIINLNPEAFIDIVSNGGTGGKGGNGGTGGNGGDANHACGSGGDGGRGGNSGFGVVHG